MTVFNSITHNSKHVETTQMSSHRQRGKPNAACPQDTILFSQKGRYTQSGDTAVEGTAVHQKLNAKLQYDPAIPLPGVQPTEATTGT